MPVYSYKCSKCQKVFDSFSSVEDRNKLQACECKGFAARSLEDERADGSNVDGLMKENERYSWSMGCHIHQIPEMMKQYPGSTYHPKTGQLLIKNRTHKLYEMKRRGYAEYV